MIKENKRRPNHTDRRVKRTKKALRDALFELLETKKINQITVTELTTLADVNRATFYFYYTDLNDMFRQIQDEAYHTLEQVLQEPSAPFSTIEGLTEYINKILLFCKEHEKLCRFIVSHDGDNRLYEQVRYLMLKSVPDSKLTFSKTNPARYSTNFVLTAVTGVLIDWMNDGMEIPTEELARFIANIYINGAEKTKDLYISYE